MTTSANRTVQNSARIGSRALALVLSSVVVREFLVVLVFCLFTSLVTWPYVTRLRDVVVDPGDPYLVAWILWWDYHQTFTDPLNLFQANIFYPLKYTLAFSEHSYGIAMLFFPMFALGFRPLTVHAVALFLGFALSGYGAFRLGRTLTGSSAVGWVSGIIFAFVPFRFNMMSQVPYVFSAWMPLVFEALILFVRERSIKRAVWLGVAFFLTGITTISWFTFTLVPFAIYAALLLTRYRLWRDREFWQRGVGALAIAALALVPFMLPYLRVSKLYGFKRSIEEIKYYSAMPIHWLAVENRNRLWRGMGESIPDAWKFKLFPGLLPILFSIAALVLNRDRDKQVSATESDKSSLRHWLPRLDLFIVFLIAVSLLAIGFDRSQAFFGLFKRLTSERVLTLLTVVVVVRLCIAYPVQLRPLHRNLIESLRSPRRCDAFWLGSLLTVVGFCFSLGWNFFFFRICYDILPIFRSMRFVARGSLLAYLGLALLAGLGVRELAARIEQRKLLRTSTVYVIACALLLIELNTAPLRIERGAVFPDAVSLRLKQTQMRGGIVHLPVGGLFNYRYMLRAADHEKPLIVGTSGFNSPVENRLEELTANGPISEEVMSLMESVPTSYLVIANQSIVPERVDDYKQFLVGQLNAGRLRFINRFDGHDDLYAIVKNEPQAQSEAPLMLDVTLRDWAAVIKDDQVRLLGAPMPWSLKLFRLHMATTGAIPRYKEFMADEEALLRGVIVGMPGEAQHFDESFNGLLDNWTKRDPFLAKLEKLNEAEYVNRLMENAHLSVTTEEREMMTNRLVKGEINRAAVLSQIIDDPRFIEAEKSKSLIVLHYFAYLHRNPDDPPDNNLHGLEFWIGDLERNHDPAKISDAFKNAYEHLQYEKPRAQSK
jgi:hypothetical protein